MPGIISPAIRTAGARSPTANRHPREDPTAGDPTQAHPRGTVLEEAILCLATQLTYSVWSGLGQTAPCVKRHAAFVPISTDRTHFRPLWLPAQKRRFA